jgi:hypothetical protein
MKLTFEAACTLVEAIENATVGGDAIMPNGKRAAECDYAYFRELTSALEDCMIEHADEFAANDADETLQ